MSGYLSHIQPTSRKGISAKDKYHDIAAATQSENIKDASQEDIEALRLHIHDKAANVMHANSSFFKGRSGLNFAGSTASASGSVKRPHPESPAAAGDDAENVEDIDNEDCAGPAGTAGEPALKKLKGNIVKLKLNQLTQQEKGLDKLCKDVHDAGFNLSEGCFGPTLSKIAPNCQ